MFQLTPSILSFWWSLWIIGAYYWYLESNILKVLSSDAVSKIEFSTGLHWTLETIDPKSAFV